MRRTVVFTAILLVILGCRLWGQIPHALSYQGVLTDASGNAVPDGNVSLTFRLYDVVAGGTALWQEMQQVSASRGVFNALLGSAVPLNLPFDKQYWLGITVGQSTELTPRVALTASPYSMNSHSTVTEPAPGQGLAIRDAQGNATHILTAGGELIHKGKATFNGSSLSKGDTALIIRSSGTGIVILDTDTSSSQGSGSNASAINRLTEGPGSKASRPTQQEESVVEAYSRSKVAVRGVSDTFVGALGESETGIGVFGFSSVGTGLLGRSDGGPGISASGNPAGEFLGEVKITKIQEDPNQDRIVVWSNDNYLRYRGAQSLGGAASGWVFNPQTGTITTGHQVHITGALQAGGFEIGDGKIVWRGASGFPVIDISPLNGYSFYNASGQLAFMVNDRFSIHNVEETYYQDVILRGQRGKGIKLVDSTGKTIAGFGRIDSATNQRMGVYGKAEKAGDLAGAFDGDVEIDGEVYASSLHIVRAPGDTLMHFNADGTSEHRGLETFKAGLQTVLTNGNILRINPSEGLTLKTPAGQFRGHIDPNGNALFAGNVSKGGGSFKIDHPLDPANKYLYHSFVESPDMMNIYNGNVTLDKDGEATVELPAWFEALNRDFRYQLTAIGAPGPNLYVARKISGNRFVIAGGAPGMEVSWQITGVRKDAYAEMHRIPVEVLKTAAERGRYLHPQAFGLPAEMGVAAGLEAQGFPGVNSVGGLEK